MLPLAMAPQEGVEFQTRNDGISDFSGVHVAHMTDECRMPASVDKGNDFFSDKRKVLPFILCKLSHFLMSIFPALPLCVMSAQLPATCLQGKGTLGGSVISDPGVEGGNVLQMRQLLCWDHGGFDTILPGRGEE